MKFFDKFREVVEGLTVHGQSTAILKVKAQIDNLFILITMGDMLGIPILPPYYSLRIVPYVFPNIQNWKRYMLRERDFTDLVT